MRLTLEKGLMQTRKHSTNVRWYLCLPSCPKANQAQGPQASATLRQLETKEPKSAKDDLRHKARLQLHLSDLGLKECSSDKCYTQQSTSNAYFLNSYFWRTECLIQELCHLIHVVKVSNTSFALFNQQLCLFMSLFVKHRQPAHYKLYSASYTCKPSLVSCPPFLL